MNPESTIYIALIHASEPTKEFYEKIKVIFPDNKLCIVSSDRERQVAIFSDSPDGIRAVYVACQELGIAYDSDQMLAKNFVLENSFLDKSKSRKFYKLSNKDYRKQVDTCAICGKEEARIVRNNEVRTVLRRTPNDPHGRLICGQCSETTQQSLGGYGINVNIGKYTTPMDKKRTIILGLEQEFEGYFYGWIDLRKAQDGFLSLGYDSSVTTKNKPVFAERGGTKHGCNEISWCAGSYSWWKHLSPLTRVCEVIRANGGQEGPSAGVHIHASIRGADGDLTRRLAKRCFEVTQCEESLKRLWLAVSGRSQEQIDRWAFLDNVHPESTEYRERGESKAVFTDHHAGISFNRHGSVEFRFFSSSLDEKRLLRRLKLVKEYVSMVDRKVHPKEIINGFSKQTKEFIIEEQKLQIAAKNIKEKQCVL